MYFKKQYHARSIRGSTGTSDPERRLRKKLEEIDNLDRYGKVPDKTFGEGAYKFIEEFKGSAATLRLYTAQAKVLTPHIGESLYKFGMYKFGISPTLGSPSSVN